MEWHENQKTTPRKETPNEKKSQTLSESTDAEIEEARRLLIGATLTQASCTLQFATLLELAVQSNSATPKTVGALSYALWEMVNLTMSMCAQTRALTSISMRSHGTLQSDAAANQFVASIIEALETIVKEFDL